MVGRGWFFVGRPLVDRMIIKYRHLNNGMAWRGRMASRPGGLNERMNEKTRLEGVGRSAFTTSDLIYRLLSYLSLSAAAWRMACQMVNDIEHEPDDWCQSIPINVEIMNEDLNRWRTDGYLLLPFLHFSIFFLLHNLESVQVQINRRTLMA